MTDPTAKTHWIAPLQYQGFEPTTMHVHPLDGDHASPLVQCDSAPACPPCHGDCEQGRSCPAQPLSRWHDAETHPAEWILLAVAGALIGATVLSSLSILAGGAS